MNIADYLRGLAEEGLKRNTVQKSPEADNNNKSDLEGEKGAASEDKNKTEIQEMKSENSSEKSEKSEKPEAYSESLNGEGGGEASTANANKSGGIESLLKALRTELFRARNNLDSPYEERLQKAVELLEENY